MRIGGLLHEKYNSPEEWAELNVKMGYSAVYFPVDYKTDIKTIDAFTQSAKDRDLVIAELGIWNNSFEKDPEIKAKNDERAIKQLELADYVGARCCVNISGSKGTKWDAPHKDNLTKKTFDEIVVNTQKLIDSVKPQNTSFSLEPMPWMFPHTPDSYLDLIKAVDREHFCVHFDFVNVINSIEKYYNNGAVILEWFDKLKPYAKSCHAKDIIIADTLTLHFSECRPGTGELDYETLVKCAKEMDDDFPVMFEHMKTKIDFVEAMNFIKKII